jgi:hypothetical protein
MSVASDRAKAKDTTTRGRSSSNGSRNAKSSSSASARARNSSARAKNNSSRSSRSPARKNQSSSQPAQSPEQRDHVNRQVWTNAGISALTAAIGVAGGVVLGRNTARKDRKVLGIPVPEKIDLGGIGQQIGNAGRQFGKLAGEVRTVREKAEQVGRILT